jgi:S-DNA-T family DNA segregation ATPase FtsK/SpoIIIE
MLTLQNPSIEGCIALLESRSERVWERTERDDDFLCVRVGKGERAFELGILMRPISFEEREAELYKSMQALVETHRHISPAPVLLDLRMRTRIGIVGNSAVTSPIIQNIIFQLTTFHSPKEMEIIPLGADRNDTDWAKIFQLPHVLRMGETYEAEVCAVQSLLKLRSQMLHQPVHDAEIGENRFLILFLIQGEERVESDFEALTLLAARGFKTCVIAQRTTQTIFPPQTELIINVTNGGGEIYRNQMDEAPLQISLDSISTEQSSRFLGALRGFQS